VSLLYVEATGCLLAHHWPGNIRELENVIERTVLFCEREVATCEDLPEELLARAGRTPRPTPGPAYPAAAPAPPPTAPDEAPDLAEGVGEAVAGSAPGPAPGTAPVPTPLKELVREAAEKVERDLIVRALNETGGNVTKAARRLQISRKSLQTKMKEFGLREHPADGSKPGGGTEGC
jgi:DNA-binding NtrC family response regulator